MPAGQLGVTQCDPHPGGAPPASGAPAPCPHGHRLPSGTPSGTPRYPRWHDPAPAGSAPQRAAPPPTTSALRPAPPSERPGDGEHAEGTTVPAPARLAALRASTPRITASILNTIHRAIVSAARALRDRPAPARRAGSLTASRAASRATSVTASLAARLASSRAASRAASVTASLAARWPRAEPPAGPPA